MIDRNKPNYRTLNMSIRSYAAFIGGQRDYRSCYRFTSSFVVADLSLGLFLDEFLFNNLY